MKILADARCPLTVYEEVTMKFDEYQKKCDEFAVYAKKDGLMYLSLGLGNEAGEFQGSVKKHIRDGSPIDPKELGDVLWYVAMLCNELGIDMSSVAKGNIDKLVSRKARDVIRGNGDNR